jgi:hypothetical protein
MGPPSSPLALSATFLAMLQARHAPAAATRPTGEAQPPSAEQPTPAAPVPAVGRGRLVDILA